MMRTHIQKQYADKKFFLFLLLGIILIFIIIFQVNRETRGVNTVQYTKLSFAGEVMPTQGKYQTNIERFDRELALIEINEAQFIMIYKRWNLIIPTIEKQLKEAGLPDDLKYIPVIESALRDNVVSSAGAVGLRQLMPATAQRYGLIVTTGVDERYDITKSTIAAISHLQGVYSIFKNRTLTAAAYNRGANGLQKSIDAQYSDNYYDLWLNNETSRYVFRILAMKYLREHKYDFFDRKILGDKYSSLSTKTLSVKNIVDIPDRAIKNKVSYYAVRKLNPWIMSSSLPEGKWDIKVLNTSR